MLLSRQKYRHLNCSVMCVTERKRSQVGAAGVVLGLGGWLGGGCEGGVGGLGVGSNRLGCLVRLGFTTFLSRIVEALRGVKIAYCFSFFSSLSFVSCRPLV